MEVSWEGPDGEVDWDAVAAMAREALPFALPLATIAFLLDMGTGFQQEIYRKNSGKVAEK